MHLGNLIQDLVVVDPKCETFVIFLISHTVNKTYETAKEPVSVKHLIFQQKLSLSNKLCLCFLVHFLNANGSPPLFDTVVVPLTTTLHLNIILYSSFRTIDLIFSLIQ